MPDLQKIKSPFILLFVVIIDNAKMMSIISDNHNVAMLKYAAACLRRAKQKRETD
jgi:hypothetical protein